MRSGSLVRVDPASRVEPNLVAAVIGCIVPRPCISRGSIFFPLPSGCRLVIGVFAARPHRLCGNRHRWPSPALARLRQQSSLLPRLCGSVHSLAASCSSASSRCGSSRRRLGRASLRQPSSSIHVSQEIFPCTRTASFRASRHPAAAGNSCIRHDAGFWSLPFSSRGFRLRPLRPTFLEEEGRTPHSRQQVISSAPGPWTLRGIPLRVGWHEH